MVALDTFFQLSTFCEKLEAKQNNKIFPTSSPRSNSDRDYEENNPGRESTLRKTLIHVQAPIFPPYECPLYDRDVQTALKEQQQMPDRQA